MTDQPSGKYHIRICDGTACHFNHQADLLLFLRAHLGLDHHKDTTDDGLFTVEACRCLGVCGLGNAIMVNDQVIPAMTPQKLLDLLERLRAS